MARFFFSQSKPTTMEKKHDNNTGKKNPAQLHREHPGTAPADSPTPGNEKDYDELVHSDKKIEPENISEQDPDEVIHLEHKETPIQGNEQDVDDMLHKVDTPEEDI